MIEYSEAVQHPKHSFADPELKVGTAKENLLGLPDVLSGGFALTYTISTGSKVYAVRCFHREIPEIENRYRIISNSIASQPGNGKYFVRFEFQANGILIRNNRYPIVKMDWVQGDTLGMWLDKNVQDGIAVERVRSWFTELATYLEGQGIAHGDLQNGNVMVTPSGLKLIDYDGMFVPGLPLGSGTEIGHKHFQHPRRSQSNFGPTMDRFSFIALDVSLRALLDDPSLYRRFCEGGETIIFKANDFADPANSKIFHILLGGARTKEYCQRLAAICEASVSDVPRLSDFLAGRGIPVGRPIQVSAAAPSLPRPAANYISAYPVVDASDYAQAIGHVGDRIELIGKIVDVKNGYGKYGRNKARPYVFVNFGPWRGQITKISIWAEGLNRLNEKPSKAWIGQWVSVTGLLDPPYRNKRHGYTHLSVTVNQGNQIQKLSESEALYRLGKAASAPLGNNRDVLKSVLQGGGQSQPYSAPPYGQGGRGQPAGLPQGTGNASVSQNQAVLRRIRGASGQSAGSGVATRTGSPVVGPSPQPTAAPSASSQAPTGIWGGSTSRLQPRISPWLVIGLVVVIVCLLSWLLAGSNKQPSQGPPVSRVGSAGNVDSERQRPTGGERYSPGQNPRFPSDGLGGAPESREPSPQSPGQDPRPSPWPSPNSSGVASGNAETAPNYPEQNPHLSSSFPPNSPGVAPANQKPSLSTQPPWSGRPPSRTSDTSAITPPIASTQSDPPGPSPLPTDVRPSPPTADARPLAPPQVPTMSLSNVHDARQIQERLIVLGFLSGVADGVWGPRSRAALRDFRVAQGLQSIDQWDADTERDIFSSTAHPAAQTALPQEDTFLGGWSGDHDQCVREQATGPALTITSQGAATADRKCQFLTVRPDGINTWRIQAICSSAEERWGATVTLSVQGRELVWSSERGPARYVRCP